MALIARRLLSVKLTLVLSTALLAGLLVHVSFSAADVTPCPDPDPTITVSGTPVTQDQACGVVDEEGGTVKTDSPATSDNPHWTSVTIPPGFPGTVTISETDERFIGGDQVSAQGGSGPVCVPSSPYTCLVSDITTQQTTTRKKPMIFRFTYDRSTIPAGKNIQRIRIFHNETRVPRCDDEDSVKIGYQLEQGQQFCHAKTVRLRNRDVRLVVLTVINGRWRSR